MCLNKFEWSLPQKMVDISDFRIIEVQLTSVLHYVLYYILILFANKTAIRILTSAVLHYQL